MSQGHRTGRSLLAWMITFGVAMPTLAESLLSGLRDKAAEVTK